MDNRKKINSIYFNPDKEGADSAACEIIASFGKNRVCSHREIYLAGLFLHQISGKATKLIAENLEVDVNIYDLIRTLQAARILNAGDTYTLSDDFLKLTEKSINKNATNPISKQIKASEPKGLDENGDAITTHKTSVNISSKRSGPRKTSEL